MVNLAMQETLPFTETRSFARIMADEFSDLNLNLCIFASPRLKKKWRIQKRGRGYLLTIPNVFLSADDEFKIAMLKWVQIIIANKFSKKNASSDAKKQIKSFENTLHDFLREKFGTSRRKYLRPNEKFKNTQGVVFNLREIFDKINSDFFNGDLVCCLRWGKEKSRTSYHEICNDENSNPFHLITIAGFYNQKNIPDFAIEALMYHEMLHIAIPPINTGEKKRSVHHRQFREMEKQFPHYKKWKDWQKAGVLKRMFFL